VIFLIISKNSKPTKKMQDFLKIIEFIFKKKYTSPNSFILVSGYIPKGFKSFLTNINSLNPNCKIIFCSKKENFGDIEELIGNKNSTVLIARYNKKRSIPEISLKYNRKNQAIKLSVLNAIHYSSRIFFGNSDRWSRPLFIFDNFFEKRPELKTFKVLILSFLNSKITDLKIAPFYDHVIAFYYINSKIILRVYQISKKKKSNGIQNGFSLIEIGPRLKIRVDNYKN